MTTKYFNFNHEQDLIKLDVNDDTKAVTIAFDGETAEFASIQEFAETYAQSRNVLPDNFKNWSLTENIDSFVYAPKAATAGSLSSTMVQALRNMQLDDVDFGEELLTSITSNNHNTLNVEELNQISYGFELTTNEIIGLTTANANRQNKNILRTNVNAAEDIECPDLDDALDEETNEDKVIRGYVRIIQDIRFNYNHLNNPNFAYALITANTQNLDYARQNLRKPFKDITDEDLARMVSCRRAYGLEVNALNAEYISDDIAGYFEEYYSEDEDEDEFFDYTLPKGVENLISEILPYREPKSPIHIAYATLIDDKDTLALLEDKQALKKKFFANKLSGRNEIHATKLVLTDDNKICDQPLLLTPNVKLDNKIVIVDNQNVYVIEK